jgi:hypothetical protein
MRNETANMPMSGRQAEMPSWSTRCSETDSERGMCYVRWSEWVIAEGQRREEPGDKVVWPCIRCGQ